jgi:SAM-dependent methyltransferase
MTAYQTFAYIYDELMDDAPYSDWVTYLKRNQEMYVPNGKKVLDIGCGTGTLSLLLKKEGYDVTGIDISEDMLAVADQKANEANVRIPFFHQDMKELNNLGTFDIVTIFCDSLNYLETEEDVRQTFLSVNKQLRKDGLLLFDVHSVYKIDHLFIGQTFAINDEKISYIWNCYEGPYPHSVEHDLSFFVLDEGTKKYDRFDESHVQRTFPVEIYKQLLIESGFEILSVSGGFFGENIHNECERIFFSAKKVSS